MGYRTRASRARGQHSSKRMHQSRKAVIDIFLVETYYARGEEKFAGDPPKKLSVVFRCVSVLPVVKG
jgi:hypothetical protein